MYRTILVLYPYSGTLDVSIRACTPALSDQEVRSPTVSPETYLSSRRAAGGHMRVSARARRALVGFLSGRRPALDERQTQGKPQENFRAAHEVALYVRYVR